MIGNKYLDDLFNYSDEDTSINQLLELLKFKDKKLINSLYKEPVNLKLCTDKELKYLTKISALIDYYLQIHDMEVPNWLRDEILQFDRPYYHSRRLSDFQKLKLQYTNPSPFKRRNVYFDLEGIERI